MPTAIAHAPPFTVPSSSTSTALVRWNGTGGNQIQDSTILVGATTMGLAADTDLVTFSSGTLTIAGTVAATTLTGAGAGITALAAANITASGTLPALNGAALTALTAANITASGTLPVLNGSALTNLDADDIATGTVPPARLGSGSSITTKFLRGDGSWQPLTSAAITATSTGAATRVAIYDGTATLEGLAALTFGSSTLTVTGHILPGTNTTYDLGSSSAQWRNIYTEDFHLNNTLREKGNSIDGTKGNWTIQEGAEDLFIVNNQTDKKYKFTLVEVA